jgi:tetratricopeptide (TPR) repeat protein
MMAGLIWNQWEDDPARATRRVIQHQLDAFNRNDYRAAYGFATPAIRAFFPLPEYRRMVEQGYPQIARSRAASFGRLEIHGDRATVPVTVTGRDGVTVKVVYDLRHLRDGWRVDGVVDAGPSRSVPSRDDLEIASAYVRRANIYANEKQWTKAIDCFARAIGIYADDGGTWNLLALAQLGAGDRDGYRRTCGRLMEHFRQSDSGRMANAIAWTCALAPNAVADPARPVQWAEKAVAARPRDYEAMNTLGAVLYRAGRFEEAIRRLKEAIALEGRGGNAVDWLFLAMSHRRLGHGEEARQWLKKAVQWLDTPVGTSEEDRAGLQSTWDGRLTVQLLRREAEALFQPTRP